MDSLISFIDGEMDTQTLRHFSEIKQENKGDSTILSDSRAWIQAATLHFAKHLTDHLLKN